MDGYMNGRLDGRTDGHPQKYQDQQKYEGWMDKMINSSWLDEQMDG